MQVAGKTVAPSLRALLEGFIDYAGLFPPAKLPLADALSKFSSYRESDYRWMLHSFVVAATELGAVPDSLNPCLSILSGSDEPRGSALETTVILKASKPVYCEVPVQRLEMLRSVKEASCFAKIRTGGLKPEAIPSPAQVAVFIKTCADLRLPFKATAGLHHPIRGEYPLTYEAGSAKATMHGFLNVLVASCFAFYGAEQNEIESILCETDAACFSFSDNLSWRGRSLTLEQVKTARRDFIHSVGSCSFEEPVDELHTLGLL